MVEIQVSSEAQRVQIHFTAVSERIGTYLNVSGSLFVTKNGPDTFRYVQICSVPIRQCFAKKCKHIKQLKIVVFILKKHRLAKR